jgi:DNA topoisomerase-6 subunit B
MSPRPRSKPARGGKPQAEAAVEEPAAEAAPAKPAPRKRKRVGASAEEMASRQREISVSEFFAKNRHLLGFDNPRKALLVTVKEAVDNSLDACEEAAILPEITVEVVELAESRYRVSVLDNGPGIVRSQIEYIFGKLLYGSKFHRLKMARGQQGLGISAAGMYGLMTTGKPVLIISKTAKKKPAHQVELRIDTSKNMPEVVSETEHPEAEALFPEGHGTQVSIELEGKYQKGRLSVDEYLEQTAIANPHARIVYKAPGAETVEFQRSVKELPEEPREIKPHPAGIELGTLIQMVERTGSSQLGGFLQADFCRIGPEKAKEICTLAKLEQRLSVKDIGHAEAEALYAAIQQVKLTGPPTDCLVPIGPKALLSGLLKGIQAEFYAASSRPPAVYRGNPFLIEAAIAYGGSLAADESARVLRFANRVPLLYQQSSCCAYKAVVDTNWRGYELGQPKNSLPEGALVLMVHMASVWVPFTSESKEAIADYDEIRKEMKLALQECGRKLGTYLRRRGRMRRQVEVRSVLERYIGEVAASCHGITGVDAKKVYDALLKQVKRKTAEADAVLNQEGKVVAKIDEEDVVIVEERQPPSPDDAAEAGDGAAGQGTLFEDDEAQANSGRKRRTTRKRKVA